MIGLEIHVQLDTESKMFCGCRAEFGAPPNTNVCPVCLGLPGALPVLNRRAIELAIRAALALNCEVHAHSRFARKNYFYPDLPKGYQITQYAEPLATAGWLEIAEAGRGERAKRVGIQRLHVEEDAGKLLHDEFPGLTAVDLNRSGVPLIEVVTEPDLRSPEQARIFLARLKQTLEYLDVSDCNMERGSLRVDANLSLRPIGSAQLATKTEIKNLNSFSQTEKALTFEAGRQRVVFESGGTIETETMLWDPVREEARPMRGKEEVHDYRYFSEPDLKALVLDDGIIQRARDDLPESPIEKLERFESDYGLPRYDAEVLTATRALADYFESVARAAGDPKLSSNWVMGEVLGACNERGVTIGELGLSPIALAELIRAVASGSLSGVLAKRVFRRILETGESAAQIIEREGLKTVSDSDRIVAWINEAVEENREEVERYRAGELKLLEYFVGEVMRKSRGAADPRLVRERFREALK